MGLRRSNETRSAERDRFNVIEDRVHVRDLHATILHLLGFDHAELTYRFQGLDQRLTGVEEEAEEEAMRRR